jgi:hypothetical protein
VLPQEVKLSREDLHEKVWTTPIRKLAPEFGLSDVGLAKICKKHQIPRPGLSYGGQIYSWDRNRRARHYCPAQLRGRAASQRSTGRINLREQGVDLS